MLECNFLPARISHVVWLQQPDHKREPPDFSSGRNLKEQERSYDPLHANHMN